MVKVIAFFANKNKVILYVPYLLYLNNILYIVRLNKYIYIHVLILVNNTYLQMDIRENYYYHVFLDGSNKAR